MALNAVQFQQYLAQYVDDITSELQSLETWAGNKADANATFDFATAKASLDTARASLSSTLVTINAS